MRPSTAIAGCRSIWWAWSTTLRLATWKCSRAHLPERQATAPRITQQRNLALQ